MSSRIESIDDSDVRYMYETKGMTQQDIADYYGVTQGCIRDRLHPDKKKEHNKKWQRENPGYKKEYNKQFRLENPEYDRKWWQTEKGKSNTRKQNANRRDLGSIELNEPFVDSEFHHIDEEHGIHIPKELHQSIRHNVRTGQGMEDINAIAFGYITEEMFDKLIAGEI